MGKDRDGAPELTDLVLEKREDVKVDRTIPLIATKAASARDRYHGTTFTFRETATAARRLLIEVRAYDDGVAFRYRIDDSTPVRLRGERTAFAQAGNPACIVTPKHDTGPRCCARPPSREHLVHRRHDCRRSRAEGVAALPATREISSDRLGRWRDCERCPTQ
jgi:hypothetical protein